MDRIVLKCSCHGFDSLSENRTALALEDTVGILIHLVAL
jgi:hypothetical protein